MNEQQPDQQQQIIAQSNAEYVARGSFMLKRIETQPLIDKVRLYLSSKEYVVLQDRKTGDFFEQEQKRGESLANDDGVLRICNMLGMLINTLVVQGNTKEAHYWYILERIRKELSEAIVLNCYRWKIHDEDLNAIINTIMHAVELFLTRTIDNKERDSYGESVKSHELIRAEQSRNPLKMFASGGSSGSMQQ